MPRLPKAHATAHFLRASKTATCLSGAELACPMSLHQKPSSLRLATRLNAYRDSLYLLQMCQHCTPVRKISVTAHGSIREGRRKRSRAIRFCQHLRAAPVARGAIALEAQRVIAIGANRPAVLKPGFPSVAGLAVLARRLRLVRGRK
jgi:hypothetical protein